MATRRIWTALAAGILILAMATGAWAADPIPVVWATDDTPGGHYIVGGGTTFQKDKPGIEIELYGKVAEELNLSITFRRMPWKLCLQRLEHNQVDGVFPASFKPERLDIGVFPMRDGQVDPSRRTRNNAYYLYKRASSPIAWDGTAFRNAAGTVAAPMGWAIVEDLKKMNVDVKEVPIHQDSPELLVQNRVEGFICLETVFDGYLKRRPEKYADIRKSSSPIWEKPYYLMLSRGFVEKHPALSVKIWDTIYKIKQSDEFSAIVDKYLD